MMSHNNSYPIVKKVTYHNRSYQTLGVNFVGGVYEGCCYTEKAADQ